MSRRSGTEQPPKWLRAPFQFRFPQLPLRPAQGARRAGRPGFGLPHTRSRAWGAIPRVLTSGGTWGGTANPVGQLLAPVPRVKQPRHSRVAAGTGSWSAPEVRLLLPAREHLSPSAAPSEDTQGPRVPPAPTSNRVPGARACTAGATGTASTRGQSPQARTAGWDTGRPVPKAASRGFYSTRFALRIPGSHRAPGEPGHGPAAFRGPAGLRALEAGTDPRRSRGGGGPDPFTSPLPPLPPRADDAREPRAPAQRAGRGAAAIFPQGKARPPCLVRAEHQRRGPSRARLSRSAAGEEPLPRLGGTAAPAVSPGHRPPHRERSHGRFCPCVSWRFPSAGWAPRVRPARRPNVAVPSVAPAVPLCPQA